MKKSSIPIFVFRIVLTLLLTAVPALAENEADTTSALESAEELRSHLTRLESLSFTFTQQTRGQLNPRAKKATGEAFFVKDGVSARMRWNYQAPDRQVIISDGSTLSMYFEGLQQMIIAPAESLQQDVTFTFFTGTGKVADDFIVDRIIAENTIEDGQKQFEAIKLIPRKPSSQIKDIRLWIVDGTRIKRIEIRDNFDTITLLNLSNIKENHFLSKESLPADFFHFTPPKGTEIIRQ